MQYCPCVYMFSLKGEDLIEIVKKTHFKSPNCLVVKTLWGSFFIQTEFP